ncbi:hypothetical protein [Bradyrhizobium sp. HKCCYLS3013]
MRRKPQGGNESSLPGGCGDVDIAIFCAVSTARRRLIIFPEAP